MKATTKCYVPVSVETELPEINHRYGIIIEGSDCVDSAVYTENRKWQFLGGQTVTHFLKPQELITFTKEEWSEVIKTLENIADRYEIKVLKGLLSKLNNL
ncbi:MAG TPA: hypothetical protein PK431_17035 [Chitinophagales bacterium]|nr:hypothetical protein [Chitinophagales bacterium]